MARSAAHALILLQLLGLLTAATRGQGDFDLSDAIIEEDKKTTPAPKKPSSGGDFNLEDAVGGGGISDPGEPYPPKPKPDPRPRQPSSSSDGFSDEDLNHAGGSAGGGADTGDSPQGVIPGVVGAIVVALAGAVSSFIAYQKKRLCFKENGEPGDANIENQEGGDSKGPVQRNLPEKV